MAKTYGIVGTKGGNGKSTTSANLGGALADMGLKTLLIDCDPQKSLSQWYRLTEKAQFGVTQLFRSASTSGCISKTDIPLLDIIVNDDTGKDSMIDAFMRESLYHFHNLKVAIEALGTQYDYVIIDTRGSKGLTQEAVMIASDVIVSPVQPNALDSKEFMAGTWQLYKQMIPKPGRPNLTGRATPPLLRVLINMADHTKLSGQIIQALRKRFDEEADYFASVLGTQIPDISAYAAAAAARLPVHRYETSRSGPTLSALQIMTKLVHELEPKLSDLRPTWQKKPTAVKEA